jgi:hypothetical protein
MTKYLLLALSVVLLQITVVFADPVPAPKACKNYYQLMPSGMKNNIATMILNAAAGSLESYSSSPYTLQAVKIDAHTVYLKFYEYGQTTTPSCIELVRN